MAKTLPCPACRSNVVLPTDPDWTEVTCMECGKTLRRRKRSQGTTPDAKPVEPRPKPEEKKPPITYQPPSTPKPKHEMVRAEVVKSAPPEIPQEPVQQVIIVKQNSHSPGLAAVLSMIFPGGGQIYNGQIFLGLALWLIIPLGYLFFILPGLFFHVASIYDAYHDASRM